ncbi:MAG: tetratricopeptide repeat protein, partial [Planctomyces sp.]
DAGVDVGAAAGGPEWQQAKLESWLGDLAWSRSLPDVAIVHFRRALELESGNEVARLKLAELLLQYGPEEAQTHLEFLQARKPDNRDVLLRLAACYRELGESERAVRVLDELLQ